MSRKAKITINESPELLRSLQEKYRGTKKFYNLEVLRLLKTGECKTIKELEKAVRFSYSTLQRWLRIYREGGLNALLGLKSSQEDKQRSQHRQQREKLIDTDGEVVLYQDLFTQDDSYKLFVQLLNGIAWQQDYIKMGSRSLPLPRQTAWYGDAGKSYTYSKITMNPHPWISPLLDIKKKIELLVGIEFNSVLLNLYRDGKDSVGWHSDDEPELGQNPVIGSVSFGETRRFMLRHKYREDLETVKVDLTDGSFLLMRGETQAFWQHQIPKTQKLVKARINLTFRNIKI